ncbi:MAG: S8 family serine peptidase [Mobilitalea sp.]
MKIKTVLFLFILCFVLSACTKNNNSTGNDDTPTSNDLPSTNLSVSPSESTVIMTGKEVNKLFDYSDHASPNEVRYKTVLADPSKLKDGGRVFATQESVADWSWIRFEGLVKNEIWGYDVRSCDISKVDLGEIEDVNDLSFNTDTVWPDILIEGFEPENILEYNKNPGLGIRALHDRGIDGSNIGIAIIDQALLLEHEQYKDNLMYYEKIHCADEGAQMHGPAVASIAVGKTIGVAPNAKLYYIAETHGHFNENSFEFDASIIADSILRVLEINKYLPENEKIRVISISRGYSESDLGSEEITNAIDKANDENIFVITTSTNSYYNFSLFGMNRDYLKDPDDFNSYMPAGWIAESFYSNPSAFNKFIMVPMGSRTYAACTGTENYEICHEGGLSWAVPWCAGFYALCCQVKPDITPEEFIEVVKSTAVTIDLAHDNKTYQFGQIINPTGVIEQLQK